MCHRVEQSGNGNLLNMRRAVTGTASVDHGLPLVGDQMKDAWRTVLVNIIEDLSYCRAIPTCFFVCLFVCLFLFTVFVSHSTVTVGNCWKITECFESSRAFRFRHCPVEVLINFSKQYVVFIFI